MIPKASQKAPKWRQNPFKIDDFCKMHSWSYFFHLLSGFNTEMIIFWLLWEPRGAVNEPSFSSLFLSWGPLGAEVVQKLSPRASWTQLWLIFDRFLADLNVIYRDFWLLLGIFFYSSLLHLCLVTGDQCSGHGGRGAAGKWIYIGVRDYPYGICYPCAGWWGLDPPGKFFRRRRRRRRRPNQ